MSFRTARRLAGLLTLAAAAFAAYLLVRGSSRPVLLNHSWTTLAATVGSAATALIAARVLTLNEAAEPQFQRRMQAWRHLSPPRGHPGVCFTLAALALVLHMELAHRQRPVKNVEYVDDEVDYLRVAREIQALPNGVGGLLPALYRGEIAEDNRHPLYPSLLALGGQIRLGDRPLLLIPEELSTAFGTFVVLTTAVIGWKMFGPAVGALASLAVAGNGAMIHSSSLIACETLLVLLTTVGWYAATKLLARNSGDAHPDDDARNSRAQAALTAALSDDGYLRPAAAAQRRWVRQSLYVGALFGLAYFTKASAAFPFFILLVVLLTRGRWPSIGRRWQSATLAIIAFGVVASPLLVRNVIRYGNPLHSFNNKLLFAESYELGVAEPDLGAAGNLRRFLGRHTLKEVIVDRFLGGLTWESFVLLRTLGPWPFDSGRAVFGAVLLIAAGVSFGMAAGQRLVAALLVLWAGWFLLFFGWYQPIASGDRFLLPLVPPLSIAASLGLLAVLRAALLQGKNSP